MKLIINMDVDSPCNDAHSDRSPERTLLAAVLERAFRDLDPAEETQYIIKALNWFNCSSDCPDWENGIRFCDCIEGLDLDAGEIDFIIKHVIEAYIREYQPVSKRKKSRKKRGELVEGQRYRISETY